MRKTLFLVEEYPPYKGGVGRFLHQLVFYLPFEKRTVIAQHQRDVEHPEDVQSVQMFAPYIWPHWLPVLFKLLRIVRIKKIEHLVVSSVLPYGLIALAIKFLKKIPYTVVVHGMDILHIQKNPWKRQIAKIVLSNSDSIVTNSTFTKNQLHAYSINNTKSVIIHPEAYCTPEAFTPRISSKVQSFIKGKKLVLSVGRLVKRKNYKTVIELASRFKQNQGVVFLISGDGPEKTVLQKLIQQQELESTVRIVQADDEELAGLYSQSKCVLFIPTSFYGDVEGFGIVGTEAASFGIPCIASNQGGVPDAVIENQTGLLFDPLDINCIYNALHRFLFDEKYWQEFHKTILDYTHKNKNNHGSSQLLKMLLGDMGESDISVVIPAYNAESTILPCIESIQRQTLQPKEIIVVDDGSTDLTSRLVASHKPKVVLLSQNNSGAPKARNRGAKLATGRYVIFLDSDILAKPRMLECMKRTLLTHKNASYCYSRFYFGWKKFPSFSFSERLLKKHNYIHTSSLIRRSDLVEFDETLRRHQDWDLWLTLLKQNKTGILYPEYLY
ncbi:MAG: hypothetical protein COV47_06330, partial [Candidatus Diapherotrites archaeon CG11_big_fil_rev_8_21_14_0_20_37_9]